MKRIAFAALAAGLAAATPAHADYLGFGGSGPDGTQKLVINGSGNISTSNIGWFEATGYHDEFNQNYAAGEQWSSNSFRNFFVFDAGTGATSISLEATGYYWISDGAGPLTYTLYDVSSDINTFNTYYGRTDIFNDLGTGTVYGQASFLPGVYGVLSISLNAAGVAAFNAAGASGSYFTLGGVVTDNAIPEPASWALMIAGFGLVGGAMRRRVALAT